MVGTTASTDFPTANAYQSSVSGYSNNHVFVTKLNPSGSSLDYSTYLAGTSADQGSGIAVDAAGAAYVAGWMQSTNFPTTSGAYQTSLVGYSGSTDAFVTKLSPSGSSLAYST